jgi:glycosyltransferase involved in cell wall biosynthesis
MRDLQPFLFYGQTPRFSVVIPARNEERLIGHCLESIRVAAEPFPGQVEVIVVLNRCSDRTEEIAHQYAACTIREDARNLARIRNAGARAARGAILVTIDADSAMSPSTLEAIDRALASGTTVGGGTPIRPDRLSAGIRVSLFLFRLLLLIDPVSLGLFWCLREDFEAIGGFNENLVSAEDLDLAKRLKSFGKKEGRPFSTLRGAHIVTSCRKMDLFGDWHVLRSPRLAWRLVKGKSQPSADLYYYDVER